MSVEPVSLAPLLPVAGSTVAPAAADGFGQMVSAGLAAVNGQLLRSDADARRLAVGAPVNLHEVMINMEETRLSFQLLVQVRNRVLEAYQDVMRTQV